MCNCARSNRFKSFYCLFGLTDIDTLPACTSTSVTWYGRMYVWDIEMVYGVWMRMAKANSEDVCLLRYIAIYSLIQTAQAISLLAPYTYTQHKVNGLKMECYASFCFFICRLTNQECVSGEKFPFLLLTMALYILHRAHKNQFDNHFIRVRSGWASFTFYMLSMIFLQIFFQPQDEGHQKFISFTFSICHFRSMNAKRNV